MADGKVTSAEVAARAGVSQSAVSRVFTPGASVAAKTAEKVRQAAEELGYRPNVLARSLITGRSRIIGLMVAYLDNYFYPDVLERLSKALQERGYHVLVFMASQTVGNIDAVLDEILDYQVDGVILASVALSSDLATRCQRAGVPVVLFNRRQDTGNVAAVTSDNQAGGRSIGRLLAAGGHERIAYVAGWEGASTQRDREAGFRQGLAEAGRAVAARAVGDFRMDRAAAAARSLFAEAPAGVCPDAVFVANDHMAFAVMDVLRFELGLDVPGDVAVVGYDDVPISAWPAYDLTTYRQPAGRMVAATVDILLDRIEHATAPAGVEIKGRLVPRRSAPIPEGWTP